MTDDVGVWNISAYHRGMMGGRMPNIDRIANEGALFTDYYVQQSCTAGRAAFIIGQHPFPSDIEDMLLRIDTVGRRSGRWPLGENWPFSAREFQWARGEDRDGARRDLAHFMSMLEAGRGDEIMIDPLTQESFR